MLLALLGPPCRFTRMCITIAQGALDQFYGGCDVIRASDLPTLREELQRVTKAHVLLVSDAPDLELAETLLKTDAPYVIVTADPANVVHDIMLERSVDLLGSIRAASLYFSTLHDLAMGPRAVIIRRMGFEHDVVSIVRQMLNAIGKSADNNEIQGLLSSLFPEGGLNGGWSVAEIMESDRAALAPNAQASLGRDDVSLIEQVLGDFWQLGSHPFRHAVWPPQTFLSIDTGGGALPSTIDLTGPFRCPVYGPYFHLPSGLWKGLCRVRVRDNHGQVTYRLDVFSNVPHFEADMVLPVSGLFEFRFQFRNKDPKGALQIRLIQTRGAIEGQMEFQGVELNRAA